eukprot:scaffold385_cov305-Pinguiococcus_pyrenoidosus.AAC.21
MQKGTEAPRRGGEARKRRLKPLKRSEPFQGYYPGAQALDFLGATRDTKLSGTSQQPSTPRRSFSDPLKVREALHRAQRVQSKFFEARETEAADEARLRSSCPARSLAGALNCPATRRDARERSRCHSHYKNRCKRQKSLKLTNRSADIPRTGSADRHWRGRTLGENADASDAMRATLLHFLGLLASAAAVATVPSRVGPGLLNGVTVTSVANGRKVDLGKELRGGPFSGTKVCC